MLSLEVHLYKCVDSHALASESEFPVEHTGRAVRGVRFLLSLPNGHRFPVYITSILKTNRNRIGRKGKGGLGGNENARILLTRKLRRYISRKPLASSIGKLLPLERKGPAPRNSREAGRIAAEPTLVAGEPFWSVPQNRYSETSASRTGLTRKLRSPPVTSPIRCRGCRRYGTIRKPIPLYTQAPRVSREVITWDEEDRRRAPSANPEDRSARACE